MNLAVLATCDDLAEWQDQAIQLVLPNGSITAYCLHDRAARPSRRLTLWTIFRHFDRRRSSHRYSARLPMSRSQLRWHHISDAHDLSSKLIDLLLDLTGTPFLTAKALTHIPALGVWFYSSLGVPLLWDTELDGGPLRGHHDVSTIDLCAITPASEVRLCSSVQARTHPTSPAITEDRIHHAAIPLLAQALAKLLRHQSLEEAFDTYLTPSYPSAPKPSELTAVARSILRISNNQLQRRKEIQWSVGVLSKHTGIPSTDSLSSVSWYVPSYTHYLADPFPIEHNHQHYVFVEEYSRVAQKGHISVMELSSSATLSAPRPVLQTGHHLSFPFIFRHAGAIYMLPEQASRNQVVLYRASAFPDQWIEERVLLDNFPGIDPVLHHDGTRWWLFVTYGGYGHQDSNLHLFSSERLEGQFVAHPKNPVKSDIAGSRMAGRLLLHDGHWYRPSQNCSKRYGGALRFYLIDDLTPALYAESLASEIEPSDGTFKNGIHTFNVDSDVIVVDGLRFISVER